MSAFPQPDRDEPRSSLKLTMNAKGRVQPEFKQYVGDDNAAVQAMILAAQENFERTRSWLETKGLLPS